ncbi:hypothetical protein JCM16303_001284 [Sporobolomyces ruberrimus]
MFFTAQELAETELRLRGASSIALYCRRQAQQAKRVKEWEQSLASGSNPVFDPSLEFSEEVPPVLTNPTNLQNEAFSNQTDNALVLDYNFLLRIFERFSYWEDYLDTMASEVLSVKQNEYLFADCNPMGQLDQPVDKNYMSMATQGMQHAWLEMMYTESYATDIALKCKNPQTLGSRNMSPWVTSQQVNILQS